MTYIPATRRNAPVSSTSTSTPILCVTALLLIYSKLAPTSARPSHGMMSREESGRLGDHVWLTGSPEITFSGGLRGCCPEVGFEEIIHLISPKPVCG
jgi:hypothetical protein